MQVRFLAGLGRVGRTLAAYCTRNYLSVAQETRGLGLLRATDSAPRPGR
jgi:hypothetical protein